VQARTGAESHALDFFCRVVAPSLAGPLDSYFWTHITVQWSKQDICANHAVLALSSFFEEFQNTQKSASTQAGMGQFATWHYNQAIKHLRLAKSHDTVLLVCILFVCIELLRGDYPTAIKHCRHGMTILNETGSKSRLVRDYLDPEFSRLSVFPYSFGATPTTFPSLDVLLPRCTSPFQTVEGAHLAMRVLFTRALRFGISTDAYRSGRIPSCELFEKAKRAQKLINDDLDEWFTSFRKFGIKNKPEFQNHWAIYSMELEWYACKVWVATCLASGEAIYDEHMDKLRSIIRLAKRVVDSSSGFNEYKVARLTMETGFLLSLNFAMSKCRNLKLRINALKLIKSLALSKEGPWAYDVILACGRRTIEIEHDVRLDTDLNVLDAAGNDVSDGSTLPNENNRIAKVTLAPGVAIQETVYEGKVARKIVCLFEGSVANEAVMSKVECLTI
jgi:hypothetical protein